MICPCEEAPGHDLDEATDELGACPCKCHEVQLQFPGTVPTGQVAVTRNDA